MPMPWAQLQSSEADISRHFPTGVRPPPLANRLLIAHSPTDWCAPVSKQLGMCGGAPMLGKITKASVDRIGQGQLLWDQSLNGFGARRQRRHIFYLLRYRLNGRQRFITIGRHGSSWTSDSAR